MKTVQVDKDVLSVVEKYGKKQEYLIPILQELVERKSYLTEELIRDVAHTMNISPNEVYSVATFYSFINTRAKGKYIVRICKTISCDLTGKDEIIKAIEKELRVKLGGTTDDRLFTLETTNCIGMCDYGPAMLVNDEVYKKLDSKKAVEIIREYKSKEK